MTNAAPESNTKHQNTKSHKNANCIQTEIIPARYVLSILTFWGMSLEFAHRVCFSVTIVAMVNHTNPSEGNISHDESRVCLDDMTLNETTVYETGKYTWSPPIQGVILGSYFYGYVCTQLLGGRLAEIYGGKWLLGFAIFCGSVLTLFTPVAAELGIVVLVGLRIMMGLLHGICLPTVFAMFSEWAPQRERSILVTLCVIGDHVGTILSTPLAGFLCQSEFAGGWPSVFYVLGSFGCVWFVFWCYLAYSLPEHHPRISRKELDYIMDGKLPKPKEANSPVPWKKILCSRPVWSIAVTNFTSVWGYTTLLTKLPTYLEVILHIPIQKNGLVNSLVYVCTSITLFFSGYMTDFLKAKAVLSPTTIRKIFQLFATLGPALCTALIPFAKCYKGEVITLLALSMALLGFSGGGHTTIATHMAPAYAGTLFGLVNGIGCTAGIFSPLIAGLILDRGHDEIQNWDLVFYISSGLYFVGAISFTLFASAELQPWAHPSAAGDDHHVTEQSPIINYRKDIEDTLGSQKSLLLSYAKDLETSYKYRTIT